MKNTRIALVAAIVSTALVAPGVASATTIAPSGGGVSPTGGNHDAAAHQNAGAPAGHTGTDPWLSQLSQYSRLHDSLSNMLGRYAAARDAAIRGIG